MVGYRGYQWMIFFTNSETKIVDEQGISVTVDEVLNNLEKYKFELLNISTHCREISLTILYEGTNLAIPVSIGYLFDTEKTKDSFLTRIIENAGRFNRSKRLSREFVEKILDFETSKRIAVFRLKPAY